MTERKQAAGRMSYERALRSWQEQAIPERAAPDPAERQVAIEALASAIRSGPARLEAQRKRRLWAVLGAGVAAAAAALFVFTGADPVPRAHVAESAPEAALAPASPAPRAVLRGSTVDGAVTLAEDGGTTKRLAAGERFEVAAGRAVRVEAPQRATIALGTEIDVFLNAETSLSLRAAKPTHPRLELGLGRVELDVHGPARDRRVIVQTPDARVTVRGTRFSVDVRPRASGRGTVTGVSVSRGLVEVTSGGERFLLSTGQSWSSPERTVASGDRRPAAQAAAPKPHATKRPSPPPTLADENRLFQAALYARNAGDDERAARLLTELLTRFPDSPLAQEARLERARALQRLDRRGGGPPNSTH